MTTPALDRWIARCLQQTPPRATSLVMTVFGDAIAPRGGAVWLGSLITLLAPLGVSERLVRTSVFRLTEEGWLEAERHGRRSQYRLSSQGERRFLRAHQRVYAAPGSDWDGRWTLVLPDVARLSAAQKTALQKELLWEGFGQAGAALFLHPADKTEAIEEVIARTRTQGKVAVLRADDAALPSALPMAGLLASCWPLAALRKTARQFITRFAPLATLLEEERKPEPTQAFVVRTLLVHAYRRLQLHDPQLPASLLGDDWPGHQAYALTSDIDRRVTPSAERLIATTLAMEEEPVPPVAAAFARRFAAPASSANRQRRAA